MNALTSLFDPYGIRARLFPAFLVVLPGVAIIALLFPDIYATYSRTFSSLGLATVAMFLLAHVLRERGRVLEKRLYAEWGGIPSTAWLRHRDQRLDPMTKARYFKFLEAHVPELNLPTAEQEEANPEAADHAYSSAVKWLIEHTRDTKKFKLLFEENVGYGFRRNTLAGKSFALFILAVLMMLAVWIVHKRYRFVIENVDTEVVAACVLLVVAGVAWISLVTKNWVKDGADAYVKALLASCEAGVNKK